MEGGRGEVSSALTRPTQGSADFGSLWAPFWRPLAHFGLPLAHFWLTFGALWLTFGALGSLLAILALDFLAFGAP